MFTCAVATQLLINGRIYTPSSPGATAMAVTDGVIVWIGADRPGLALHPDAEVIDVDDAFVAPAFVDSHVHVTAFGLTLTGVDLSEARSREDCLAMLRASPDDVVWAQGWDETRWGDGGPLTQAEVDDAVGNRLAYVPRIDAHSAVVSSALQSRVGPLPLGLLTGDAHHRARSAAQALLTAPQRDSARRAALDHAAARGVVAVHECGGPNIAGIEDFRELLALDHGVEIRGLWGEAAATADEARQLLATTGAAALAGDLFIDGSIGSRTAAVSEPYMDGSHGNRYLDDSDVLAHLRACTEAGIQAGFHAIGDAAIESAAAAFAEVGAELGTAVVAALHHRLDHAVMITADQIRRLAECGVIAAVQPRFEELWGGSAGTYSQRLGESRASTLLPLAPMAAAGMPLSISSDAPVTSIDPWTAIRAAVNHRTPGYAVSPRAAFGAATRGGWRAAGVADGISGMLVPGAMASYAVWEAPELIAAAPKDAVQRWSTDPRSLVPPLPPLTPNAPAPTCLQTVHRGKTIYAR